MQISSVMKGFLVLCLSISLVSSYPRPQEEEAESRANVSLEEEGEDMMAADRVMAVGQSTGGADNVQLAQ